jgi:hypothetical protein
MALNLDPPAFAFRVAGITGVHHHVRLVHCSYNHHKYTRGNNKLFGESFFNYLQRSEILYWEF